MPSAIEGFRPTIPPTVPEAPAPAAQQDTFLRLLVAQLQNQNPLDPSDPIQFVTQLAQFSALEQTTGIRQQLASIESLLAQAQNSTSR